MDTLTFAQVRENTPSQPTVDEDDEDSTRAGA